MTQMVLVKTLRRIDKIREGRRLVLSRPIADFYHRLGYVKILETDSPVETRYVRRTRNRSQH